MPLLRRQLERVGFALGGPAGQRLLESGGGQLPRTEPTTALEEAQEVIYLALQVPVARRAALARQALTISPDCIDAYLLLAEAATDPQEARHLYEQGVAGERTLGAETFTPEAGHFWSLVETRPYIRAREGLAHVLWHLDERTVAIGHTQALLQLNPNDNQGIRYVLASWLLAVDDADAWSSCSRNIPTSGPHIGLHPGPAVGPTPRSRACCRSIPALPYICWGYAVSQSVTCRLRDGRRAGSSSVVR